MRPVEFRSHSAAGKCGRRRALVALLAAAVEASLDRRPARRPGPAIDAGCVYFDSTGEDDFIRAVFERHAPAAERSGATLVTAFGWDFVPGNLAAALALGESGDRAARVEAAYFMGSGGFPWHQ